MPRDLRRTTRFCNLPSVPPEMKKPKNSKKRKEAKQAAGRLGAEQWLAVRQKSGAGPMEPKPRRGTRAEREREALERESGSADGNGR
jgi:hypothetical protein